MFVTRKKKTSFKNSNLFGQLSANIKLNLDLHKIWRFYISGLKSVAYAKIFHRTAVLNLVNLLRRTYLRACYLCDVQLQSFIKILPKVMQHPLVQKV